MATTYYASQAGGGNGLSQGSPTQVNTGIGLLALGDTLKLLDGTYTGTASMITIADKNTGTQESHRRTISALNDGAVTIDGQSARRPVDVYNSTYWTLEGFNAKRGGGGSGSVVSVRGTSVNVSAFAELKRICAWDAENAANRMAFSINDVSDVLVEDCAGFGTTRYCLLPYKTNRVTVRRGWFRWNQYNDTQPKAGVNLAYNVHNSLFENCIFEWDKLDASSNNYGNAAGTTGNNPTYGSTWDLNVRVYGCIAYALTGQNNSQARLFFMPNSNTGATVTSCTGDSDGGCITGSDFLNTVGYVQPSSETVRPFELYDNVSGGESTITKCSSFKGTGGSSSVFSGNWINNNHLEQDTIGAYNLYADPPNATGATIRFRYVDGVITATELWPFPMANRIEAALLAGGYASHNINTVIQSIFGTFPSIGGDVTAPAAPTGLTVARL